MSSYVLSETKESWSAPLPRASSTVSDMVEWLCTGRLVGLLAAWHPIESEDAMAVGVCDGRCVTVSVVIQEPRQSLVCDGQCSDGQCRDGRCVTVSVVTVD